MSGVSSLLTRLKQESKKSVAKAAKDSGVTHRVDTFELFGAMVTMKRVLVENQEDYTVGWIMDNQTDNCMRCNSAFSMLTWRHHCRSCGYVICTSCGDKKLNFTAFQVESPAGSRVCRPCFTTPINKTVRKGPPTLVSRTPVAERQNETINLSRSEITADTSCNTSAEACSSKAEEVFVPAAAPEPPRLHAPKLRPTARCDVTSRNPQTAAIPTLPAHQPTTAAALAPVEEKKIETSQPAEPNHPESRDCPMPLPVFDEPASVDSSILSTATKTARNTAINGTLVAPPPKRGQTCTAPEIFSPVAAGTTRKLEYLDLQTPPSGGSIGYGETITDFTKFGSPLTRKLIMDDARHNGVWVAEEDDLSSTNGSSAAPTPTSGISGTTNGGAGVGYIHSPWNQTYSPFGSQQKPTRLLPHTGQSSIGRSGRRRSSSASRVRFADASFSAEAGADILGTAVEVASPSLPLTREQLQVQQERYRAQFAAQQQCQAQGQGRLDLRGAMNDVENVPAQVVNRLPAVTERSAADKGATKSASRNNAQTSKSQHKAVASAGAGTGRSSVNALPVPSLDKPHTGRAAPR